MTARVGDVFSSVEALYEADPRRRASRESDYGVWWVEYKTGPRWTITHLIDTDETFAVCAGGWGAPSAGHVEIIAVGLTYGEVDTAMGDDRTGDAEWTKHCGAGADPAGVSWVRGVLRQAMRDKAAR